MTSRKAAAAVAALLLAVPVAGCGLFSSSADTYSRDQVGQPMTLARGVVLSIRPVKVEGTRSPLGAGAGAVAGGVAGSMLGGNSRVNALGAIGGAVLGGLAGAAAEEGLTSQSAFEIVVQPDGGGQPMVIVQPDSQNLKPGDRVLMIQGDKIRVVKDGGTAAPTASAPTTAATPTPAPGAAQTWTPKK